MSLQTQLVADTLRFDGAGGVMRGMTTRQGSPPTVDHVSDTASYRVTNRTIQLYYPCGPLNACAAGPEGTFIDLEMITMLDGNNRVLYVRSR